MLPHRGERERARIKIFKSLRWLNSCGSIENSPQNPLIFKSFIPRPLPRPFLFLLLKNNNKNSGRGALKKRTGPRRDGSFFLSGSVAGVKLLFKQLKSKGLIKIKTLPAALSLAFAFARGEENKLVYLLIKYVIL